MKKYRVLIIIVSIIALCAGCIAIPQWLWVGGDVAVIVKNESSHPIDVKLTYTTMHLLAGETQTIIGGKIGASGGSNRHLEIFDSTTNLRMMELRLNPAPYWPGNRLNLELTVK